MLFRSKNHVIDLREKIIPSLAGRRGKMLSEEESNIFINSGLINLDVLRERENLEYGFGLDLWYRNVDVIFKKDKEFTIEYDITFEESDGSFNYTFIAKFKRIKFTETSSLLGWIIFAVASIFYL